MKTSNTKPKTSKGGLLTAKPKNKKTNDLKFVTATSIQELRKTDKRVLK